MNGIVYFDDYQYEATKFAKESSRDLRYLVPGLTAEAGEVADKYAKAIRDNDGVLTEEIEDGIAAELGDVLWFVAILADYLGFSLEEIAQANLEKLADRKARGVIGGSGDNR